MNLLEDRIKLDEIDLHILEILQRDGRLSNTKLAKEVGLSAPPMLERVKKLERSGVIKSYRAILDAEKIGRSFFVFAAINLNVKALSNAASFEESVAAMSEVLECHHIAGDIDFLLKINVQDQEGYKQFVIEKLAGIEGIKGIRSWVVLSTFKDSNELSISRKINPQ